MKQRHKNISLVLGLLLLLFIAYRYSFSKTLAICKEVDKLESQRQSYQSAPIQLAALANKEKQLDKILHTHNVAGNSVQQNLLKALNVLSTDLGFIIVSFEEPHQFINETTQQKYATFNFVLQGDYQSLLKAVYALEQDYSFGNVIQVDFQKKKNFRTRTSHLQCQVLLQRLN